MITGGSNFNVARNQKRLDAARKKLEDLIDFQNKATDRAIKRVQNAAPQEVKNDEYTQRLLKDAMESLATVARIDSGQERGYARELFVSNLAGRLKRAWDSGNHKPVQDVLNAIKEKQAENPKPLFSTRHSIWKILDKPIPEKKSGAEAVGGEGNHGATMTLNHDKNGVEIKFPEKPPQSVIDQLSGAGFRYSRYQGLWYAKQSPKTLEAAKRLVEPTVAKAINKRILVKRLIAR